MPKTKDVGTTAKYENNGQTFETKKAADNYGLIVQKVNDFTDDEDIADTMLAAYREGVFELPKATRKAKDADE